MDITLPDFSSLFGEQNSKQDRVSSIEAFKVWDGLRTRYISMETYKFYKNLVHDQDLKLIMSEHIDTVKTAINKLEQIADQHKITTPSKPPEKIKFSEEIDQISDKFIFRKLYAELIFEIYLLTQGIIDSTVNDQLRQLFIDQTLQHLNTFKQFYKYGKLKGWTEIAPSFEAEKQNKKEIASESEASHLWNLINLRYNQIRFTKCYKEIAHDVEFKKLLEHGLSMLEEQVTTLENLAANYEVPLPEKPPAVEKIADDPEMFEDEFMFQMITKGIQDAIRLYIRALIEGTRNDPLQNTFFELLEDEISVFDKMLRYGKVKGWTDIVPMHSKS